MCQQTRVDTVIPYYERFLKRFPTIATLAKAPEDDVLALWSGLGYYRRARLLHKGVREVVSAYGGAMPSDASARLGLPGIGRYTAGAIGSIAFHKEEPIVDGNVKRVLSRLFVIDTPLGRSDTENAFWEKAQHLVRGDRPGDFNQAMMELGATICTPTSPRCDECPVRRHCRAKKEARVYELPVVLAKKAPKIVQVVAVIARAVGDDDAAWLQRCDQALFGGLWNLPMLEGEGRDDAQEALRKAGLRGKLSSRKIGDVVHILSHRRMHVEVWTAVVTKERGTMTRRYVRHKALKALGVSRLTQKLLATGAPPSEESCSCRSRRAHDRAACG
jgi:A/G-specific adenine glycosylase